MEQAQVVLDVLAKLAVSPLGQAVLGVISISVLFLVFALVKAGLRFLGAQAAKTPTPVDDQVVDGVEEAVNEAETGARAFIKRLFKL